MWIFVGEVGGAGADFEGSYYQSRIECIWPQAMLGVCAEGCRLFRFGVRGITPENFIIC